MAKLRKIEGGLLSRLVRLCLSQSVFVIAEEQQAAAPQAPDKKAYRAFAQARKVAPYEPSMTFIEEMVLNPEMAEKRLELDRELEQAMIEMRERDEIVSAQKSSYTNDHSYKDSKTNKAETSRERLSSMASWGKDRQLMYNLYLQCRCGICRKGVLKKVSSSMRICRHCQANFESNYLPDSTLLYVTDRHGNRFGYSLTVDDMKKAWSAASLSQFQSYEDDFEDSRY